MKTSKQSKKQIKETFISKKLKMKNTALQKLLDKKNFTTEELTYLLKLKSDEQMNMLFDKAYEIKTLNVGRIVFFRGIIEFSNICDKDCYYCGIRKSNSRQKRFSMTEKEIIESAKWAYENQYGSIVLQSGERSDPEFTEFICNILKKIKKLSGAKLGITLSLGEQNREVFQKWFDAGAHRYLLRIETSNAELYKQLHPPDHSFEKRRKCLEILADIGYQVGTGVMMGLPGQTPANLAEDILFFKDNKTDMIGMGPYIPHKKTPLFNKMKKFDKEKQLTMGLKMIACTRLVMNNINIAATTALQALNPTGRELGLQAGANIIMPNITNTKYRAAYQLYEDKPCIDENSSMCRSCLQRRIESINEEIGFSQWGDSPYFFQKNETEK